MRVFKLKNVFIAIKIIIVGYSNIIFANTQTGALGSDSAATDSYQVTCSSKAGVITDHLETAIEDNPPVQSPLISVMIFKDTKAINSTDSKDGDKVYSPVVSVQGGNGIYTLFISKTAINTELYTLAINCKSATNTPTTTTITALQNQ